MAELYGGAQLPHLAASRPVPASTSADDIRAAAAEATASLLQQPDQQAAARGSAPGCGIAPVAARAAQQQQQTGGMSSAAAYTRRPAGHRGRISLLPAGYAQHTGGMSSAAAQQEGGGGSARNPDFLDEEALFETPQYLRNMAAGIMMSPPRFGRNSSDDSPDHPSLDAGDSLWS
ncbi:ethylene-responsive transcription factor ERF027-like [Miscanthus floridulus]|uniref:ethylene-responsive transcription factor ERF027-like n=1 Tax=Miscanthus floridulus TaxID=154761 RepID=UPI00345A9F98